ncbi:unnamed protein product [Haemonchus placei]|uniref:Serpentine receptor class gamma n=1 Tax=Haemonchus placei TaxID=6290 RepID=A0A158QRE5_HAEPC|nr:unnamed protein product [Haemonchus placei]
MELHGMGYAGVGIGVVVLTIMRHHVGLHRGYHYLANIFKLYEDPEAVVSCKSQFKKNDVVTMFFYGTAVFNFPYRKTQEVISLVGAYSNPKVLFQVETYAAALRLAISSAGLCVCGLFCASSFRKRNGNSYMITWIAFWCNYMSCFMSVFAVVVVLSLLREASPGSLISFSVNKQVEKSAYGYGNLLASTIIFMPSVIPLIYLVRKAVKLKKDEKFSKLFEIAREHPAFLRISAESFLGQGKLTFYLLISFLF